MLRSYKIDFVVQSHARIYLEADSEGDAWEQFGEMEYVSESEITDDCFEIDHDLAEITELTDWNE